MKTHLRINHNKKLFLSIMVILMLTAVSFCYFIHQKKAHNISVPTAQNATASDQPKVREYGLPVRLKISDIGVNANIEYVGLTVDGAMDVPKDPANVAWLTIGARPGENGSAVMAGHFGPWKSGAESIFNNLHKLKAGSKIITEDDLGKTLTFIVRKSLEYDSGADASDIFYSNDGLAHLNLITCDGVWSNEHKSYSNRLVVLSDKE